MGYTHYYDVNGWKTLEWQCAWRRLLKDVPLILEAADVLVQGPGSDSNDIEPPVVDLDRGIVLNGLADDSHETFVLSRKEHHCFVKTLQKPYDLPVACILLRAHVLCPDRVEVFSDGYWDQRQWVKARLLYRELWPYEKPSCPWNDPQTDDGNKLDRAEPSDLERVNADLPATTKADKITDALKQLSLTSFQPRPSNTPSSVENIDLSGLKDCLHKCQRNEDKNHSSCQPSPMKWTNLPGTAFRVISIRDRCIVNAPDRCRFVALSYVWGGVDQVHLTKATATVLTSKGGLDVVRSRIPTTICDAINVCDKLGMEYLWVDALCIVQDSKTDMKLQILRMREIYASAVCTIAAISSDTAEAGLLPATITSQVPQLGSEEQATDAMKSSTWSSRGWCFQEKVLSHRLLVCSPIGICLSCQHASYNSRGETLTAAQNPKLQYDRVGGMLDIPPNQDLESFICAVESYSTRRFTKYEDKNNAFQGVFQRYAGQMDGYNTSFCYGLPIHGFDQLFCWRTQYHDPQSRRQEFPSWSWIGWDAAVTFDREAIKKERTNHMIYGYNDQQSDTPPPKRKPANWSLGLDDRRFGFPAASDGLFYNDVQRYLNASVVDLMIGTQPLDSRGTNDRFNLFPALCSEPTADPPSPPTLITFEELLSRPMPKLKIMSAEMAAAPSLPAAQQSRVTAEQLAEHRLHASCEADNPIASIWLDREWRAKQPDEYAMQFLALEGIDDPDQPDESIITSIMCLQRMAKLGEMWAHERFHIADCRITQRQWLACCHPHKVVQQIKLV